MVDFSVFVLEQFDFIRHGLVASFVLFDGFKYAGNARFGGYVVNYAQYIDSRHPYKAFARKSLGAVALIVQKLRWLIVILAVLQLYCWWTDEMKSFESATHPLRVQMREVLESCLAENYAGADKAFSDGLSAAQIEAHMTPWWDDTLLGELLCGGWAFRTLGVAQIDFDTAHWVYKRYATNERLNDFLALNPDQVERLKAGTVSRFQIIRWLKLRGRGSMILAMLLTRDIRVTMVRHALAEDASSIISLTREAFVAGGVAFGDGVTFDRTESERQHAHEWLRKSLRTRIDDRVGIYLMSAYVNGSNAGTIADIQAMLNEAKIVSGNADLLAVDGFWGPGTLGTANDFLGENLDLSAGNDPQLLHNRVRAKWKARVEPAVMNICVEAIKSGDPTQLIPLLRNRYSGHIALYNGLNSLRAAMANKDEKSASVAYGHISACWASWTNCRKGCLWDYFTDEEAFRKSFPTTSGMDRRRLTELSAQYFLTFRLAPRQLGREVSLQYSPARWFGFRPKLNTLERITYLANERGWLIDPP